MSQKLRPFVVICSFVASSASFAADTQNAAVSTTTTTQSAPSFLDGFYLNYFATFHGPSTNSLSSPYTVDRKGVTNLNSAINFDSEITAAYMFTPTIGVGPDVPFLLVPVLGQGVILGDVGIKAFNAKTISYRGFDLYTNLLVQAPTNQRSSDRGMTFALKTTPYVRYRIPSSRFTIGAWTEEKAYFGVRYDKTFKLYGAPYVNYSLTQSFSLNLEFEAEAHHNVGDTGTFNFTMYQTDLEPGFVWKLSPRVLVNPYLQIFTTNNDVSADRVAVGAVISATVL